MNTDDRPNPDKLLQAVQQSERSDDKGCLKIFLGMAAGVGKTYAMLEAAQKLRLHGVDVVIGVVNTHGRAETAALTKGLKTIPLQKVNYKGSVFEELNLDEILKTKPQLVLIDELAHSNIPGVMHAKRWQDVVTILNNGIDIYTTLNVQHIESLKEFIESITGISIRETVPDSIIESANFFELIDITPGELLERLKQGKVYLGDMPEIAARNFFKEDRLTALREILLRYAAEKIDHDLHSMVSTASRAIGWKHREKLLVAINHLIHAQKLIRTTRRLAFNLNAPWIALHVDNGEAINSFDREILSKNLSMARDLGAEVVVIEDANVADTITRLARQHGVTQVIIGQPANRFSLATLFGYTLLDQLTKSHSDFDIHIVRKAAYEQDTQPSLLSKRATTIGYLLVAILLGILLYFFFSS